MASWPFCLVKIFYIESAAAHIGLSAQVFWYHEKSPQKIGQKYRVFFLPSLLSSFTNVCLAIVLQKAQRSVQVIIASFTSTTSKEWFQGTFGQTQRGGLVIHRTTGSVEEQDEPTQSAGPQQSNPPTQGLGMKPKPLFIKAHLPNSCHEGAIASRSAALLCSNTLWGDRVHWIWVTTPSLWGTSLLCWDTGTSWTVGTSLGSLSAAANPTRDGGALRAAHTAWMPFIAAEELEKMTSKEHLWGSSCGAQLSLQWASSSPSPLLHGESCFVRLSCCPVFTGWDNLPSKQERGTQSVGVGGGGFQNTTNRYSPRSNFITALPGAGVCGHIFCLPPRAGGRHSHLSPRAHGRWVMGHLGLHFISFGGSWWGQNIGTL